MHYIAKDIDTEKILAALEKEREYALYEHRKNIAVEEARYNQRIADIIAFEGMFKCSNYEHEKCEPVCEP